MSIARLKNRPKRNETASVLGHVIPVIILLAALGVITMIWHMAEKETSTPPTEAPPINVTVQTVSNTPEMPDILKLPGHVEANRVIEIAAEVSGRIEQINCKEGHTCAAGDSLITLNADRLTTDHKRTLAQYKGDKKEYERMKSLVREGAGTQKDMDDAESRMAVSQAMMEAARIDLDDAQIESPISGVLNDVLVEKGEYVNPGTPVVEMVDIDTVKVVVFIPEPDIPFFETGEEATVVTNLKGEEKEFAGAVTYISALADPRTRSTRMEITLDNRKRLLHSGQVVDVRLKRRTLKDVIMIPLLAVIPLEDGKAVYVVENDKAARREVTIGFIKGNKVRVTSGLEPGDLLIVAGHRYVSPGQPVKIAAQE